MNNKQHIYRAIDANVNRSVEGLRVVEDALRFLCDNAAITSQLRQLRHALRGAAASLPGGEQALLNARDSARDIARNAPPREQGDITGLVRSNLARAQEATRSLEEFSKLLSPEAATAFGEIRFKLYDLEKDIATAIDDSTSASAASAATLTVMPAAPFLYAIADYATLSSGETPFANLHAIINAGAKIIQLRDKPAPGGEPIPDKELLDRAKQIAAQIAPTGALFFVNDRTDIALASGAHGVHLGADDLPIKEARAIVSATAGTTGANTCETATRTATSHAAANTIENCGLSAARKLLIGVSTHTVEEAIAADALNPDYVAFGPVFASPTKSGRAPLGADALAQACAAISLPVVAIGGITQDNIAQIAAAGASGAAVISALSGATGSINSNSNPAAPEMAAAAAQELGSILESNYRNPRR